MKDPLKPEGVMQAPVWRVERQYGRDRKGNEGEDALAKAPRTMCCQSVYFGGDTISSSSAADASCTESLSRMTLL
jgi:hypothetical protein